MRRSILLAAAAAVAALCASGAAQAAHVGVYVGADAPVYYAQAPYYPPAPPPQYIQRGPDGEPEVVPGQDAGPPPYPPGAAPQYAPDDSTGYPPGTAPQYPADTAPQYAPQYAPGAPAPAPGDAEDGAPQYQQGAAPQTVTPQASGDTWYFCDANKTYYPYVKTCPSGWRPVPAQPAQQ